MPARIGNTTRAGGILAGVVLVIGLSLAVAVLRAEPQRERGAPLREDDRAAAFGYFLDSPVSPSVIDESLALAEALRRRYGIDTGNAHADRITAARKAQREILDGRTFSDEEIEDAARALGYGLAAAECADYCENVRRLAVLHLKMALLRAHGEGDGGAARDLDP
jgi:hypothetical protein